MIELSSSILRELPPEPASPGPAAATVSSRSLSPASAGPGELSLESAELPAGSQLGNYLVLGCIGRGAMASVYRAEHALLHKQVALKVMAPALHASTEARQRFLREARAVAAIQHPNVVSITDAGLFEGTPYLVMELLDGEDLQQHLQHHGPFAASELPAIALPIVAALAAAHDAGVIHRDLKPGNIFLARGSNGELVPKLLDFGISKFASPAGPPNLEVTAFDQLIGSPLYLPPEALRGSRELTARSDQYSLGVVLYECITGQAPFYRDDLVPLLNAICEGSCPAPRQLRPETPPQLEQVVLRAMSVDPRQRFADLRELGRALLEQADADTRQRWSSTFAAPAGLVLAPPEALVVAPAQAPPLVSLAARPARRRQRSWTTWALLASGCALLALALGRTRQGSAPAGGAPAGGAPAGSVPFGSVPAPAPRWLALEPAGFRAAAGGTEPARQPPVTALLQEPPLQPGAGAAAPAAPGGPLPLPDRRASYGSSQRSSQASSQTSGPIVAVLPLASAALAGPSGAKSEPGSAPASRKPRSAARAAAELEDARELSRLFLLEPSGRRVPAARRERTAPAPSPPAPVLVNEAPLFD